MDYRAKIHEHDTSEKVIRAVARDLKESGDYENIRVELVQPNEMALAMGLASGPEWCVKAYRKQR